jgi:N-formylglutamate deformylase
MSGEILLHIPHSSTVIPSDVRAAILLDDAELEREVRTIADLYTDELFVLPGATRLVYPWCRLVVDPERFRDDASEAMSAFGMGAVYVKTVDGRPLRNIGPEARDALMKRCYDPHHARLESAVTSALESHDRCLIVDCHSFTSRALPFEKDRVSPRPDICIGTCDYHTPEPIARRLEDVCAARGISTRRNWPFAGTMTPLSYYRRDARVRSVMIEVNRGLYLDEPTGKKSDGFEAARMLVSALLEALKEMA